MAVQLPVSVNFPPALQTIIMGLSCGRTLKTEDIPLLKPFLDCSVAVWISLKEEFVHCFPPKDDSFHCTESRQAAPPAFLFYVAFRVLNDWTSFSEPCRKGKIPPGSEAEKFFWNSSLRIAELIILDKSRDMHYIPEDQLLEYQRLGSLHNNFLSKHTELTFINSLPKEFTAKSNKYSPFLPTRCLQADNAFYEKFKQVNLLYTHGTRPLATMLTSTEPLQPNVAEAINLFPR
jgi:hypothetical protein